mmetsp:Transcript_46201/g.119063  ORF Transcript_46201/g.119063 Transcript_46201/m.119063 type:complete len:202 (-) Transcript_46201:601-1206(-)
MGMHVHFSSFIVVASITLVCVVQVAESATIGQCCSTPDFATFPDCGCKGVVQWPSLQSCSERWSCADAKRDYQQLEDLARQRAALYSPPSSGVTDGSGWMSRECQEALQLAVCAYHFPRCSARAFAEPTFYPNVCLDVCELTQTACNVTIADVAVRGSGACSSERELLESRCTRNSATHLVPAFLQSASLALLAIALLHVI